MSLSEVRELIKHWSLEVYFNASVYEAIDEDMQLAEHKLAHYERMLFQLELEENDYDDYRT